MNILRFKILGICLQMLVVLSRRDIATVEEDEEKSLDNAPRVGVPSSRTDDREGVQSNDKDSLSEETQNFEATPAIVNGPDRGDEQTKIPMTCVSDYIGYCQIKFEGFRFQDGCHTCTCTKVKKDFCEKGPCRFFAHSFEHAATYCNDINKQNDMDYTEQLKKRMITMKEKYAKSQPKSNTRMEYKSKKSFMKDVDLIKKISIDDGKVERTLSNKNGLNEKTASEKDLSRSKTLQTVLESDTFSNEQNQTARISRGENNMRVKADKSKSMEGVVVQNVTGRNDLNEKKLRRENPSRENIKKEGKRIQDKVDPIKSSLKKMSDKKMLRHIIYLIALNELNIKKIRKSIRNHVNNKETKSFTRRLKAIHHKNSMFKSKILEIVKIKLKLSKSNYGPFHHKFDQRYLRRIDRKLSGFNEELHEMKGGVKLWTTMSKTLSNAKASSDGNYSSRISFVMIFVATVTFYMFRCYNKS